MLLIRSTMELTTGIPPRCRVPLIFTTRAHPETTKAMKKPGEGTRTPARAGTHPPRTCWGTAAAHSGPLHQGAAGGPPVPDPLHGGPLPGGIQANGQSQQGAAPREKRRQWWLHGHPAGCTCNLPFRMNDTRNTR